MVKKSASTLCIKCKGYKKLCGLPDCPYLDIYRSRFKTYLNIYGYNVDGSTPPSLLVGEYGYPKVNIMLNIPPSIYGRDAEIYDSPIKWWGKYSLDEIIKFRASLLATTIKAKVNDPWKLYEKEINISAVSLKPVDSEAKLYNKPVPSLRFDTFLKPVGLSAKAEDIRITSNPILGRLLEKRIYDDLKASKAVIELYESGYSIYTIINALSGGLLGNIRYRKIVPTRWSITAVDSILGEYFRRKLINKPYINKILTFKGEYLDNKFLVILYPGPLELEWIEAWHPRGIWTLNSNEISMLRLYEDYRGKYEFMDGGYMAARLPVLEYLYRIGRQATVFIYREVKPGYYAPVGNWHIRETVKNMLVKPSAKYNDLIEAFKEELKFFDTSSEKWIKKSKLFHEIFVRKRITNYIFQK